ncbi:MAG: SPOR domain-containing protein, partial [Rhodoferax sp.]|nr:SPOR domain-containing protein [Rhodoferax sp.]
VVSPPAASPTAEAVVAADKPTPVTPPPGAGARVVEADKALALLEGKDPAAKPAAAEGRFIVQVGAFADADKVREVRRKVEALGVKTYTQVVDTKDGSRIRVRVGPFADKAEATRIAEKIRKLDLSASILSL